MTPQRRAVERLSVKLGIFLAVLLAFFFLVPVLWRYLSPFIVALPFAALIQPVSRFLKKRLRFRHALSILLPVLLLLLIMLAVLIWFLSYGVQQVARFLENPGAIIGGIVNTVGDALDLLLGPLSSHLNNPGALSSSVDAAMTELTTWGTNLAVQAVGILVRGVGSVPDALIYINFLFMGLYFISRDYEQLLSFLPHRRKTLAGSGAARLTNTAISGAVGYLRVQLIYGGLSIIASAIFWSLVGNPYAIIIALAAGVLEFIPLIGNGAVYLPWTLVELILGHIPGAFLPLGIWAALYIIRRLTEPKIMAQNIGISPLLSLISMFIGYTAGGLPGMILGPVLMTVAVAFVRSGYLVPVKEDILVLFHGMRRRWRDENLIATEPDPAAGADDAPADAPPAEDPPPEDKPG